MAWNCLKVEGNQVTLLRYNFEASVPEYFHFLLLHNSTSLHFRGKYCTFYCTATFNQLLKTLLSLGEKFTNYPTAFQMLAICCKPSDISSTISFCNNKVMTTNNYNPIIWYTIRWTVQLCTMTTCIWYFKCVLVLMLLYCYLGNILNTVLLLVTAYFYIVVVIFVLL